MSEPKSDEEIVEEFFKRFKSEGEKMLNVKAEEYENWLRTTLAAVRKEERERAKEIVMNYPLSDWSGEAEVYDQLYEIAQRITLTQDV